MTDLLLQVGVSNLCISIVLALVAWTVQSSAKRPFLAHLLWLLVLVNLVTPPILTVPVVGIPGSSVELVDHGAAVVERSNVAPLATAAAPSALHQGKYVLALLWLLGTVSVLLWSAVRIYRFNRLLRMASQKAPQELQSLASEVARRLGLSKTPTIYTTSAQLSPMVWWIGSGVRVVIPAALAREMDSRQLRLILAHELAHVRRRDHLVRWLEWLACVCFWWNPVAWWARRNLRVNEEICCDALVLQSLKPRPRIYANSLLTVVEFLASPAIRPPAMASEINSGGFLERRFRMIISGNPVSRTPRWLHSLILLCAFALLPLGVAHAQSQDYKAAGAQLKASVEAGEITVEQARVILEQLGVQLRIAVAAGELTEVEAKTFMAALQGIVPAPKKSKPKADRAEVLQKLEVLVASGELTQEEARARLAEWENAQKEVQAKKKLEMELAGIKQRLAMAIEAGQITEEQAKERLEAYLKKIRVKIEPAQQDPRMLEARRRIEAAVEAGEIAPEDAKKRLEELLKKLKKADGK